MRITYRALQGEKRKSKNVSRKIQVGHARLQCGAPNKSTTIFCHKPVNLLRTDNSEDRCVWLKCGWGI